MFSHPHTFKIFFKLLFVQAGTQEALLALEKFCWWN